MSTDQQLVFIGEFCFPDGDAAATRALSLARIGRDLGYGVTVIGKGALRQQDYRAELGGHWFDGICYMTMNPVPVSTMHRLAHPIERLTLYASTLEAMDLTNVCAVVINASGSALHLPAVRAFCKRRGIPLIADVCEWYDPRQFPGGRLNPAYTVFSAVFRFWFPRLANMIVVSSLLERHFKRSVGNVVRIPAPFDMGEITFEDHSPHNRLVLVYAGSPGQKDRLREFLLAMALLTPAERSRVELRLIGPSRVEVQGLLGISAGMLEELGDSVMLLGRMPRDRVLEELRRAHFSLLLRPNKRYANAGFPSKVAESLAAGVPVMLNYTSDLEEYLGDGSASIRVDGSSPAVVVAAIRSALALSPGELSALRRAARAKAEQFFDYRRSLGAFRELLAHAH